ncbi:hypothetical protein PVAND_007066 [Polypedilum vanderplanki]|uniref:Uncharacterized protein n=1 Tax=Polypedilum vanderplanki TaxID=319348 RepID=A0A9J6C592_POLVA|nr:hypothetical protein PVAND_007066 [Polypedilum vanderplanki]
MFLKLFVLLCLISISITQDETEGPKVTHIIHEITTTTMIPNTTEPISTTTSDLSKVVFDSPEIVINELNEAWSDLNRTVYNSIANFMKYSKEKLENEILRIFMDLEKVESYDRFEKLCPPDQVTAYEEFQTSVDGLANRWILIEHSKIDDSIEAIYKTHVTPLQQKVRTEMEAPITTKLRFPKGNKEKYVTCAKQFVPKIISFIETAFNNVIECLVMNMNYKETLAYQESITAMYEETAGVITTCNGVTSCLKKNCPKFHLLVLKTVKKAAIAMTTIITNFRGEVANITTCTKTRFLDASFTSNMTALTKEVRSCFS